MTLYSKDKYILVNISLLSSCEIISSKLHTSDISFSPCLADVLIRGASQFELNHIYNTNDNNKWPNVELMECNFANNNNRHTLLEWFRAL